MLRFLRGFALGDKWGGATLMAVEHAREGGRSFYARPQMGSPDYTIDDLRLYDEAFALATVLPVTGYALWRVLGRHER